MNSTKILGIETSCDETGLAIYDSERGLLAHCLHSQVAEHAEYGGVVPELASRDHIRHLLPLLKKVLADAGLAATDLDAIAYTAGPGLIGALLVGAGVARSLAFAWDIPCLAIHHLEGHLLAPLLETPAPSFPFLALLVSGAHTMLVDVKGIGQYKILGESLDDAAGEAFDKTAKLLGLGYPGGPALAKLAESGDKQRFRFPRPMTNRPGLDFSFSGLKTFALNTFQKNKEEEGIQANIACAFQEAVVETLAIKCRRALQETGLKQLVVAGGVSANHALRERLAQLMTDAGGKVFYPRPEFCTDNGAMIAYAGYRRFLKRAEAKKRGEQYDDDALSIVARARWPMDELT